MQVLVFVQNQVVFPSGKAFTSSINTSLIPLFQPTTSVLPKKQMIISLLPYSIPSHFGGSCFCHKEILTRTHTGMTGYLSQYTS